MKGNNKVTRIFDLEDRTIGVVLSFVAPLIVLMSLFMAIGVYPFGDKSYLFSDMWHQYMPFMVEFVRSIKAGEGISYSLRLGLGSNELAMYVYYLASPINWLVLLVPEGHIMEFMTYLSVIKMSLCGTGMYIYLWKSPVLKTTRNCSHIGNLCLCIAYALSGFMAAYNWNLMWLDCVILFPVIVLGLEMLCLEEKPSVYCLSLAFSILTNYYISIMICMFLVLYFLYVQICVKFSFKAWGRFALYSMLAGGMAAVLLIPEVCAIMAGDFAEVTWPEKIEWYFNVVVVVARQGICVSAERGLDHWPNIYCGVIVFLGIPLYVMDTKVALRQRIGKLFLTAFMLVSFCVNVLDLIWHGMNYPDSLPARQSFIYIFLLLVMSYEAMRDMEKKEDGGRFVPSLIKLLVVYVLQAAVLVLYEIFEAGEAFFRGLFLISLLFVTLYGLVLFLYMMKPGKRVLWCWLLFALMITETTINLYNTSLGTTYRDRYLADLGDMADLYVQIEDSGDGLTRVEKFERRTKNEACLGDFASASYFSSTINSSVGDMYKELGMRYSKVFYCADGATPFTMGLLNVGYMYGTGSARAKYESPLLECVGEQGNVYLYRNKYTLPFGFVAPLDWDIPKDTTGYNALTLQNRLSRTLGEGRSIFSPMSSAKDGDDVTFKAPRDGAYYGVLTTTGTGKLTVIGGGLESVDHNDLKKNSVVYLGYLHKDECLTITNNDPSDTTPGFSMSIYHLQEEYLEAAFEELAEQHMTDVEYANGGFEGHLSLETAGRLIMSIPYEKGLHVYVNGGEVEPEKFGGCLVALELNPGEYDVQTRYVPEGLYRGIAVSLISMAVYVGTIIVRRRRKNTRKQEQIV